MRYILLITVIILASAQTGRSQCAPQPRTGNFGFSPATEMLACVERGFFYDQTFYIENVDSFVFSGVGSIRIDTLRIDSIINLPCGVNWISDRGGNTYLTGQTGCIRLFGITNDTVGQYELKVYVTIVATLLGKLQGDINQIIHDLESIAGPLGVDFKYFIRVKETGNACPNINRNPNAPQARIAKRSCAFAGVLSAQITGDTAFCRGTVSQLNLAVGNATNPAIEWLPASAVSNPNITPTTVGLTKSAYVTVAVTDTANTGHTYFDRVWVQIDTALPLATFTQVVNGRNIKLTSTSLNAGNINWTLGDQSSEAGEVVLHTYSADGSYPITLTVSNNCGTDTYHDTLHISTVGVSNTITSPLQFKLSPNPAHGSVSFTVLGSNPLEEYSISVLDISGKQVLKPMLVQHKPNAPNEISVEALQPGIYIFQIKTLHSSTFSKLIIY
ncbi:hypothetical protein BH09BAC1_BH09BAC1_25630 [soil metagenome]